jgi:hypothetical protein
MTIPFALEILEEIFLPNASKAFGPIPKTLNRVTNYRGDIKFT